MEIFFDLFMSIYVMFALVFLIVPYVLRALGLYKLAKNQELEQPWLAWIPIADSYILSKLAKKSPYIKRKVPNIHIILPSLFGGYIVIYIAFMVCFFSDIPFGMASEMFSSISVLIFYILFMLFALFVSAAYYFTLYHVYESYDSQNNVLYTVLSIIFRLSFVFLFVIRNKKMVYAEDEVLEE